MAWVTPKHDWTTGGITNADLDLIEGDEQYVKDRLDTHTGDADIHKTITQIRTDPSNLRAEIRTSDPGSPAVGRIWVRGDI